MLSTKNKLETIVKKFPAHKMVLSDFYKSEEKLAKEEIVNKKNDFHKTKESIIQKVKNIFEQKPSCLQSSSSQEYKYCFEVLEKDHLDYVVLEKSFMRLNQCNDFITTTKGQLDLSENIKINRILRVVLNDTIQNESSICDCPSLLLLHGTNKSNVEGILKEGFKPSQNGNFGPGVYLTNCCSIASGYSKCYINDDGMAKLVKYILINKVKQVEESSRKYEGDNIFQDYINQKPIVQTFNVLKYKQVKIKEDPIQTTYDSKNNKIIQGTFRICGESANVVLAHHDLVIPTYLIEIQDEKSIGAMADDILYEELKLKRFTKYKQIPSVTSLHISQKKKKNKSKAISKPKTQNKVLNFTVEALIAKIEKEIIANHKAQLKNIMNNFNERISSVIQQISFNLVNLVEGKRDAWYQYKTAVLQTDDKDYQFIIRSITDKNSENNSKVLHILKINPVNQNEVSEMQNKPLYLYGVKAHKVDGIIKNGFDTLESSFSKSIRCVSKQFETEFSHGRSFCNVDNKFKKLSFVFVTSPIVLINYRAKTNDRDSSKNYIIGGSFRNNTNDKDRTILTSGVMNMAPQYLIVIEVQ